MLEGIDSPRLGVLVADDDPGVLTMLGCVLRRASGFSVHLAAGGEEAVEFYKQHQDTVDVVLLDVRMPGMDGHQTLAALREVNPGVRAVLMTADPTSCSEFPPEGVADPLVVKPFQTGVLSRLLRWAAE